MAPRTQAAASTERALAYMQRIHPGAQVHEEISSIRAICGATRVDGCVLGPRITLLNIRGIAS